MAVVIENSDNLTLQSGSLQSRRRAYRPLVPGHGAHRVAVNPKPKASAPDHPGI